MIINAIVYGVSELDYIPITTESELSTNLATTQTKPLKLMNNITATASLTSVAGTTNTLDLNGKTLSVYGDGWSRIPGINVNGTLTLNDTSSSKSGSISPTTEYECIPIQINSGGALVMNGGKVEKGYSTTASKGSGILTKGGTFTMNGGEITNCIAELGGSVGCSDGGIININGGKIHDNVYDGVNHCAGICAGGGTVNISGGEIYNNNNTSYGGGVMLLYTSTLNLTGSVIRNNTADYGAGVYVDATSTVTISNGIITGNTANTNGGGVCYLTGATYTKTGGTILGNSPDDVYEKTS